MALIEKTLELNVTHEILVLGQGIWTVFWSAAPAVKRAPTIVSPPIYASGITLREEKKKGYDIQLEVPAMAGGPAQVAFLQFKLGKGRTYSLHKGTMFPRSGGAKSRHALFEINNNSGLDQHCRLRSTARAVGRPNAAIYALPLFTDEALLRSSLGKLIPQTAFFTVPNVDANARHDPVVNGKKRHIAISTQNSARREIRSQPRAFEGDDCGADLIGEIASVRLHRAMVAWSEVYEKRSSPNRGLLLAREIVTLFASLVGASHRDASDLFELRLGRTQRARLMQATVTENDGALMGRVRSRQLLEGMARHCSAQVKAINGNQWEDALSDLRPRKHLAVATDGVLKIRLESDDAAPMRLAYLIV